MRAEPARMESQPSMALRMPEPQTLLMVVAGRLCGRPAAIAAWRAGACPRPRRQHAAEDSLIDLLAAHACVANGSTHGGSAELRGARPAERALKSADRRAPRGDDENILGHRNVSAALNCRVRARRRCFKPGRAARTRILPYTGPAPPPR